MIIAQLIGGLGNQMFQYAMARHLAKINNTTLKIDLTPFEDYKLHKYSLHHLGIVADIASKEDLEKVTFIKEKHFHYDVSYKEIGNNVLLKGYWQTEKYFNEIPDIIRHEFAVKTPLGNKNLEVANLIKASNSVCLHIRRCDYVPNTYGDQIFDSLTLDYYFKAIELLAHEKQDLKFFIFSDDPGWVKDNVKLDHSVVYVDHNTAESNYEDLRLMSLCNHNIIANSSFSWWGAWLNKNRDKKVYAPKNWFNSNVRNLDPKDIIPESWYKI
ncbi:MAG: alpha-1,2-fucosyltransferase [Candidatus Vogelbacteria bacterium]|nr:alpha-1,2-fucosyltransferase [Candidatus Vogelbacteria bacterium]